jgi:hypothetical protein
MLSKMLVTLTVLLLHNLDPSFLPEPNVSCSMRTSSRLPGIAYKATPRAKRNGRAEDLKKLPLWALCNTCRGGRFLLYIHSVKPNKVTLQQSDLLSTTTSLSLIQESKPTNPSVLPLNLRFDIPKHLLACPSLALLYNVLLPQNYNQLNSAFYRHHSAQD